MHTEAIEKTWVKTDFPVWKTVIHKGSEIDLVRVTPYQMGLKMGYHYYGSRHKFWHSLDSADVAERGFELGLSIVPREVLETLKTEAEGWEAERAVEELGVTQSGFGSPETDFITGSHSQGFIYRNRQTGELRVNVLISSLHDMYLGSRAVFVKPRKRETAA